MMKGFHSPPSRTYNGKVYKLKKACRGDTMSVPKKEATRLANELAAKRNQVLVVKNKAPPGYFNYGVYVRPMEKQVVKWK